MIYIIFRFEYSVVVVLVVIVVVLLVFQDQTLRVAQFDIFSLPRLSGMRFLEYLGV